MSFTIIINADSGSVQKIGADSLRAAIESALPGQVHALHMTSAAQFQDTLKNNQDNNPVLIGGGDGSIRTAATIMRDRKKSFGVIPLGTMNLFAQDIGLPNDPLESLRLYRSFKTIKIDYGTVNNEMFLCNAMIGITTDIARDREDHRNQHNIFTWLGFIMRSFAKLATAHPDSLSLRSDSLTRRHRIKAAIIANNAYDNAPGLAHFHKKSLTDGKLSIYTVAPQGHVESLALLSKMLVGGWADENCIERFDTTKLRINTYRRHMSVMIDGELKTMRLPLRFEIKPRSLSILVPEGS
ncbi:MAG: hypothetical protein KKA05_03335 [Alphaproteobacteria bacterium]|nr:hypothetical protein [Alphaproteobacteria bacterium]MBU0858484.1 hypothetical protein [Alphaproteobacteria bacterium]